MISCFDIGVNMHEFFTRISEINAVLLQAFRAKAVKLANAAAANAAAGTGGIGSTSGGTVTTVEGEGGSYQSGVSDPFFG